MGVLSTVFSLTSNRKPINHILVIRASAMGDVAMTVPVLVALTKANPQIKITVLTRDFFVPFFEQLPNVTVFPFEVKSSHKGVLGLQKLATELKKLQIDAVADLHNVLRSNTLKVFFSFSGIPFIQIDKGRAQKKALTSWDNKVFEPLKTSHERYAEVFRKLGFSLSLSGEDILKKQTLEKEVQNHIGFSGQKWLGIAPFAQHQSKVYPLAQLIEVIESLNATGNYKMLLFGGGKKEQQVLANIAQKYEHAINMAGVFDLKTELSIISNLDVMLSMDSGNGHMAALFGVPVITLWGVTHPYAGFSPFGQPQSNSLLPDLIKYPKIPTSIYGNKVPEGYENVMETIKPETVKQKIIALTKEIL